jgi:hypothetical protein
MTVITLTGLELGSSGQGSALLQPTSRMLAAASNIILRICIFSHVSKYLHILSEYNKKTLLLGKGTKHNRFLTKIDRNGHS